MKTRVANSGAVLPIILLVTLAGLSILIAHSELLQTVKGLGASRADSQLYDQRMNESLLKLPAASKEQISKCSGRCCKLFGGVCSSYKDLRISKQLAGAPMISPRSGRRLLPQLDFHALFTQATLCPSGSRTQPSGEFLKQLSPSSIRSANNCRVLPSGTSQLSLIENLDFSDRTAVFHGSQIYIAGAAVISELELRQSPSLLLAGGDISISKIRSVLPEQLTLILYSATGRVTVDQSPQGNIHLIAISELGGNLPEGELHSLATTLPILEWDIWGFRKSNSADSNRQ